MCVCVCTVSLGLCIVFLSHDYVYMVFVSPFSPLLFSFCLFINHNQYLQKQFNCKNPFQFIATVQPVQTNHFLPFCRYTNPISRCHEKLLFGKLENIQTDNTIFILEIIFLSWRPWNHNTNVEKKYVVLDITLKQYDGEVPVMLELWGTQRYAFIAIAPWSHPGVVAPDRVLAMGQNRTKLRTYVKLNCLK